MKKGDQIKVLLLDRNVMDNVSDRIQFNKIYKPKNSINKTG